MRRDERRAELARGSRARARAARRADTSDREDRRSPDRSRARRRCARERCRSSPRAAPWWACPWTTSSGRCMPIGPASRPDPEERPDRLRLADDRVRDRRVVEEHDALVAARDRLEPLLERLDLEPTSRGRSGGERLAEVRDLRARESADEALRARRCRPRCSPSSRIVWPRSSTMTPPRASSSATSSAQPE